MPMLKIDLSGRMALVTGASGELGRVIARTLAACGADVAVHYFQARQKAEAVLADVRAAGRRGCLVRADVGDESSISAMRDAVTAELGSPDIVVANAVAQYPWATVLSQKVEDYQSQFRSCVLQAVLLAKAFAPAMMQRRRGRFIGINTECVMQNWPAQSAYVSGKRGMDGVWRVLAKELGEHQITVNQVAPGWMISDKYRGSDLDADYARQYAANVPLKRRGEDQDVANAVAFLASDLAGFISGAFLPVCGGNVMVGI